jgi:ABC-type amino acid transport substrate-binding protein
MMRVVQERITQEKLGVTVPLGNHALHQAIDGARARLRERGILAQPTKKWLQP